MALNAMRNNSQNLSARKRAANEGFDSELFYGWSNRRRRPLAKRSTLKNFGVGSERNMNALPSTLGRNIPPELLTSPLTTFGVKPYRRTRDDLSAREAAQNRAGIDELQSRAFKHAFQGQMIRGNPSFYSTIGASPKARALPRMSGQPRLSAEAYVRQKIHESAFPMQTSRTRRTHKALTESVKRRIQAEAAAEQSFLEAAAAEMKAAPSVANLIEKYRSKR